MCNNNILTQQQSYRNSISSTTAGPNYCVNIAMQTFSHVNPSALQSTGLEIYIPEYCTVPQYLSFNLHQFICHIHLIE